MLCIYWTNTGQYEQSFLKEEGLSLFLSLCPSFPLPTFLCWWFFPSFFFQPLILHSEKMVKPFKEELSLNLLSTQFAIFFQLYFWTPLNSSWPSQPPVILDLLHAGLLVYYVTEATYLKLQKTKSYLKLQKTKSSSPKLSSNSSSSL